MSEYLLDLYRSCVCLKQKSCCFPLEKKVDAKARQTHLTQVLAQWAGFLCFMLCQSMKTQSYVQKSKQTFELPLESALSQLPYMTNLI